ncbi:hypothetical protein ACFLUA_03860 [Chloroflexota bacterium]
MEHSTYLWEPLDPLTLGFGGSVISPKAWKAPRTNGGPNNEVRRQDIVYADYNYVGSFPLETDTRIVS